VEVKGVAGSLVRFFLTANEHKAARVDVSWRLVVVRMLSVSRVGANWTALRRSPTPSPRSFKFASATKRSPTDSCAGDL
jgi:hypothetical protein